MLFYKFVITFQLTSFEQVLIFIFYIILLYLPFSLRIYIKAPLCNVNSFAPRDYTRPFVKTGLQKHSLSASKSFSRKQLSNPINSTRINDNNSVFTHTNIGDTLHTQRTSSSNASVSSVASIRSVVTISERIEDSQLEGLTLDDVDGWYCRDEDAENSWRPINEKGYKVCTYHSSNC